MPATFRYLLRTLTRRWFSLITSEPFWLTDRFRYQFVGEVITNIHNLLSTKEIIHCVTLGIPRGDEKIQFLLFVVLKFWSEINNIYISDLGA